MTTDRNSYTAGLRALADFLDAHPDIRLPYTGTAVPLTIYLLRSSREDFVAAVKALPGKREKVVDDHGTFRVRAHFGNIPVEVVAYRDAVCERVVTGTRAVTREVPDPQALAAVPTTTLTETVEDVEWVCAPLLSEQVPA